MNNELVELLKILAIGGGIGLFIGLIMRVFFKKWLESFKKGSENLGWMWFMFFGVLMLGMALYSWREGSDYIAVVFLVFAVLEFFVMAPRLSIKRTKKEQKKGAKKGSVSINP